LSASCNAAPNGGGSEWRNSISGVLCQRDLLRLPVPPGTRPLVGALEIGGARRSLLPDARQYALDDLRLFLAGNPPPGIARRVVQHPAPIDREVLNGEKTGRVRPVFEQRAFRQQFVQPAGFVVAHPAPQHQIGTAGDHADGVYLQQAHAPDRRQAVGFARRCVRKLLQALRR
jgi:hypothetical protein